MNYCNVYHCYFLQHDLQLGSQLWLLIQNSRNGNVSSHHIIGAAYGAGLATGFWNGLHDLEKNWKTERSWTPRWSADRRESGYARWKKAVERTLNWIETS